MTSSIISKNTLADLRKFHNEDSCDEHGVPDKYDWYAIAGDLIDRLEAIERGSVDPVPLTGATDRRVDSSV